MKKVLSAFLVSSFLLLCAAPVFSLAAGSFNSTLSQPVNTASQWFYPLVSNDEEQGILICVDSPALQYRSGGVGLQLTNSTKPSFNLRVSQVGTYTISYTYYDLRTGITLSSETGSFVFTSTTKAYTWTPSTIMDLSYFLSFPSYFNSNWADQSNYYSYSQLDPSYVRSVSDNDYINWDSLSGGGGGDDPVPPVVDLTQVIRSRIPRPYGNNLIYYIADHEYLYSIFVAHPFSFETQGKIDTTVTPNEYTGEQYNQFSVMFSQSSTGVNLRFTNKCQYLINCYINTYDVVDGSFVRSYSTSVNAGSLETPSIHNYNLQLSDASTYGIYQSGFMSRDGITSYPELRISWSDTIDYSTDFFVLRSGVTSLVEGMATQISNLQSANSTLTAISTTSSSILSQIESFYTLVSDYFTWFKGTFYDNLNAKWTFTNNYLVSIYNLLNETDETMEIQDDTSGVAAMESAKNDLVVTNSSGQTVDAGDAAAVGLSEAAVQIGEIAQPVGTINSLMQTIVFDKPKLLLPVIVALGLGLMVTILGKNKSD